MPNLRIEYSLSRGRIEKQLALDALRIINESTKDQRLRN